MCVVHEAVEDAVRDGGVADLLVPASYGELRGEDGRARLIALVADFPEVTPLGICERSHGPVIDDQDLDAAESRQQAAQASIGTSQVEVAEQRRSPRVEHQVSVAAGFLSQSASQEALATPVGPMTNTFSCRWTPAESLASERISVRSSPREAR